MGKFRPGMSWSLSRERLLTRCPRAYYYHYYRAAGIEEDATAMLSRCRNTLTVDQWLERVVQRFIQEQLSATTAPADEATLCREIRQEARRSRRRMAAGLAKERLTEASDTVFSQADDKAAQAIARWRSSSVLGALLAEPRPRWKPIEAITSFKLAELTVWCRFDAAFSRADGSLVVINWRLRQPRTTDTALMLTLMAARRWHIQPEMISVCTESLRDDVPPQLDVFSAAELIDMHDRILNSTAEMRSCLDDVTADIASEGAFPVTKDRKTCDTCRFRTVCPGPTGH
jgi:hypothetical protein